MRSLAITMLLCALVAVPALADVTGSTVILDAPLGNDPGQSFTIDFQICNNSPDGEAHYASTITLPECLLITGMSYDDGAQGLVYTTTGIGTNVARLIGEDPLVGELATGECLHLFVDVTINNCGWQGTDLCYDWDFVGDGTGAVEHVISGIYCPGTVAVEEATWGTLKSQYR